MATTDDIDLLRRYASLSEEAAFAALVRRHLNLVYSSALRQVRDPHLAEEIAQTVFVLLARKAGSLGKGTILTGWLYRATRFVASEALRSAHRRRIRESAAMEILCEPKAASPWEEIEPLLDEAMARLGEKDRTLVLLRYFEDKSLKELGDAVGITEDAAQKRVARAVEKLRAFFAQRGPMVSTSALTAALTGFAVQAAPAGVASSVMTAAAAVSVSTVTASLLTHLTLQVMTMTKIKTAAVAVVAVAALTVPLVVQQRALREIREEKLALQADIQELRETRSEPSLAMRGEDPDLERYREEAAEVYKLRSQVSMLLQELGKMKTEPAAAAGRDPAGQFNPMAQMEVARELMTQGRHAEALEHYLWCFDEGVKHAPAFVGVRGSFLLNQIQELGKVYPPAREALAVRRDAAEARIVAGSADLLAIHELVQMNANLNEPGRNVELFDLLPDGHPGRAGLADMASEQLVNARRYQDLVDAGKPEAAFDREEFTWNATAGLRADGDEFVQAMLRRRVVESGARGVEALAGAGQIDRANALADKVLQFDASPETRGELLKHARRAERTEVIEHLNSR